MKRRLLTGLGLTLIGSAHLMGCASSDDQNDCQPGDIDCAAPAGGDGKADGFDYKNDPTRMSQHLTYDLSKLPKKGFRDTPVWKDRYPEAVGKAETIWADTYWPTSEGSHNNRWQGPSGKSPLEKYDAAFNNAAGCATYPDSFYGDGAKAKWDAYYNCAGPPPSGRRRTSRAAATCTTASTTTATARSTTTATTASTASRAGGAPATRGRRRRSSSPSRSTR